MGLSHVSGLVLQEMQHPAAVLGHHSVEQLPVQIPVAETLLVLPMLMQAVFMYHSSSTNLWKPQFSCNVDMININCEWSKINIAVYATHKAYTSF